MTKLVTILVLAFAWALPQGTGEPANASRKVTYAVVVNANNACKETGDAAKSTVKKLYLKDLTQWTNGTEAKPYAREGTTPEQAAFVKEVLGMNDAELARHWLKLKNMNGSTPPKDVDSERMLLKYIAKHDGAFGVVKIDAAKAAEGVRTLFEF